MITPSQLLNIQTYQLIYPLNQPNGVFISQLVRCTRINKDINGFIKDTIEIIHKLTKQNYNIHKLIEKFIHFGRFYPHLWTRFGCDILNKKFIKKKINLVNNLE